MSHFQNAVKAFGEPLASAVKPGKQALLKGHKVIIRCADDNEQRWTGSIELDEALKKHPAHAQANRWDYGLGYTGSDEKERALWVEVHSAYTGEVNDVIKKFRWLRDFLNQDACRALKALTDATPSEHRYVWVASGRYDIPANSPQLRALRAAGLEKPKREFRLPK